MGLFSKIIKEAVNSEDYDFEKLAYSFARSILSYLRENDLSQKDLAVKLNVSEAWISKVLSGETNLTLKTIIKIARSMNCKVNDIILHDDNFVYDSISNPRSKVNTITQQIRFPIISFKQDSWEHQERKGWNKACYNFNISTSAATNTCTGLN